MVWTASVNLVSHSVYQMPISNLISKPPVCSERQHHIYYNLFWSIEHGYVSDILCQCAVTSDVSIRQFDSLKQKCVRSWLCRATFQSSKQWWPQVIAEAASHTSVTRSGLWSSEVGSSFKRLFCLYNATSIVLVQRLSVRRHSYQIEISAPQIANLILASFSTLQWYIND